MSQFPQIVIKHNIGNVIQIPNEVNVKVGTYLSSNTAIGATTLPADNAIDFSSGNILLLLSAMGAENAEIAFGSSHTDVAFTVTATKMPHTRGDTIRQINYDQIVIKKSATIDGAYSDLVTQTLQVTQQNTIVLDAAGLSTDFYKVQWKNSQTGAVSELSEPISVLTYPENSVANIILPTLKLMGIGENDPKITIPFCLEAVDQARKFAQSRFSGFRFAWREKFQFPIKVLAGNNFVDLPEDIDFLNTDRSVLAARFLIGNVLAPYNLKYIDKRSWNQISYNVQGGINESLVSIGGVTITLNSAGDFPNTASGVAYVATDDYDQEIMQIAYTAVDLTTNQLTGVTGVTRAIPAGARIWSNPNMAQPQFYTIWEGKLYFDSVIPNSMQGNNLYIDYYKKLERVVDLYQLLEEYYREIYKSYLRYAIKYRRDNTLDTKKDPDFKNFEDQLQAIFNNLYSGQTTTIEMS